MDRSLQFVALKTVCCLNVFSQEIRLTLANKPLMLWTVHTVFQDITEFLVNNIHHTVERVQVPLEQFSFLCAELSTRIQHGIDGVELLGAPSTSEDKGEKGRGGMRRRLHGG